MTFFDNKTFTVNGVSFEMVYVEGGTTEQGSDAYDDEYPVHRVTLSDYYIGKYEVTQELWEAVMGSNPSYFKGAKKPVERVSWNDCQEFISRLNSLTGKTFRLPTEAEWEYAARGGKNSCHYKYSGSNNIDDVAWYSSNSGETTHPVGTKAANELGIYDMSGNVEEWCSDRYDSYSSGAQTDPRGPSSGSYRVLRGGSWFYNARCCRVSYRINGDPSNRYNYGGLRLAFVP
ncbi:MAG: formylglycine-generating enzyme family protein [Candidatus Limimorpha sp.]